VLKGGVVVVPRGEVMVIVCEAVVVAELSLQAFLSLWSPSCPAPPHLEHLRRCCRPFGQEAVFQDPLLDFSQTVGESYKAGNPQI
jgi:hypothetical protein